MFVACLVRIKLLQMDIEFILHVLNEINFFSLIHILIYKILLQLY